MPDTLFKATEPAVFPTSTSEPADMTPPPVWFMPPFEFRVTLPEAVIFLDSSRSFALSIVIVPLFAVRSFDRVILPPFVPPDEPNFMSVPAETVPKVTSASTLFTFTAPVAAVTSTLPPDEKSSALSVSPIFAAESAMFPPAETALSRSVFCFITPVAAAVTELVAVASALNVMSFAPFNIKSPPDTASLRISDMSRASSETVLYP